jgi:hypothetical protein
MVSPEDAAVTADCIVVNTWGHEPEVALPTVRVAAAAAAAETTIRKITAAKLAAVFFKFIEFSFCFLSGWKRISQPEFLTH